MNRAAARGPAFQEEYTVSTEFPLKRVYHEVVANFAAGASGGFALFPAPFAGRLVSATYAPNANITGADSNTRTVSIVNKGASGAGTTVMAALPLVSGANATAFDEKVIPLSGTEENLTFDEGDVIAWVSTHAASGLADPGGLVSVEIERA